MGIYDRRRRGRPKKSDTSKRVSGYTPVKWGSAYKVDNDKRFFLRNARTGEYIKDKNGLRVYSRSLGDAKKKSKSVHKSGVDDDILIMKVAGTMVKKKEGRNR